MKRIEYEDRPAKLSKKARRLTAAYVIYILLALIALMFLFNSCDTGTGSISTDQSDASAEPYIPPENTDPPTNHDIIGLWKTDDDQKYFRFQSDMTFMLYQYDLVTDSWPVTASGNYVMVYHAINDGGIHLYDTMNGVDGIYWYNVQDNYPTSADTTIFLDAAWTAPEVFEEYRYVNGGNW